MTHRAGLKLYLVNKGIPHLATVTSRPVPVTASDQLGSRLDQSS